MTLLDIRPLIVPASLDAPDAGDFAAMVALGNAHWRRDSGTDLHDDDPLDALLRWQDRQYTESIGLVARRDGAIVAIGSLSFERSAGRSAEIDVLVAHGADGTGADDALIAELEELARRRGRTVLQGWTVHPPAGGERLAPPTGAGSVGARDPQTRRMLRAGYALGQVERVSVFDLHGSYASVDALRDEALERAGSDYRVVWWAGATPPEHADGYARAIGRMSTDVPSGALAQERWTWDAARLRARDERLARVGHTFAVTLVVHEPTGEVAAFNELTIGSDRTRPTSQHGTLVMPEHRGRRLGTIVKCEGLRRWHDLVPESPCVATFNAEENRYMLDVNEAVGFVPAGSAGGWEKTLG